MKDKLQKALSLLGPNGENWIKGSYALNSDGTTITSFSRDAVKFCMIGACLAVGVTRLPTGFTSSYNDSDETTFKDVKRLFEKAIRKYQQ